MLPKYFVIFLLLQDVAVMLCSILMTMHAKRRYLTQSIRTIKTFTENKKSYTSNNMVSKGLSSPHIKY